jgi:HSP20 family protein
MTFLEEENVMRSLLPWNQYQELTRWHRDIDDLFRHFFAGGPEGSDQLPGSGSMPAMEVFEREGQYVIRADIPGIDPKEVEVSVLNDALTIKGERKKSHEVKEKESYYSEAAYGRFERRLALPKGIDPEKITARFENGVLEISVPLPQSVSGKKVSIEIGSDQPKQIKAA